MRECEREGLGWGFSWDGQEELAIKTWAIRHHLAITLSHPEWDLQDRGLGDLKDGESSGNQGVVGRGLAAVSCTDSSSEFFAGKLER
jgi:hypothetical protein